MTIEDLKNKGVISFYVRNGIATYTPNDRSYATIPCPNLLDGTYLLSKVKIVKQFFSALEQWVDYPDYVEFDDGEVETRYVLDLKIRNPLMEELRAQITPEDKKELDDKIDKIDAFWLADFNKQFICPVCDKAKEIHEQICEPCEDTKILDEAKKLAQAEMISPQEVLESVFEKEGFTLQFALNLPDGYNFKSDPTLCRIIFAMNKFTDLKIKAYKGK